jgi:hypothetical protein
MAISKSIKEFLMALFDVGKGEPDRSQPKPNHDDVLPENTRMAHQTLSTSYSPPGTVNVARVQMQGNRVDIVDDDNALVATYGQQPDGTINLRFYDNNEIPVAQFGRFSDGSTALKVAKANQDVSTAPDSQLIFNSSQDIFKIVGSGTVALSGSYSHGTGSQNLTIASQFVPHNLGYIPAIQVFAFDSGNNRYKPVSSGSLATDNVGIGFSATYQFAFIRNFNADANNLYFEIDYKAYLGAGTTSGPFSETYKYYLLQETAN